MIEIDLVLFVAQCFLNIGSLKSSSSFATMIAITRSSDHCGLWVDVFILFEFARFGLLLFAFDYFLNDAFEDWFLLLLNYHGQGIQSLGAGPEKVTT